MEVKPGTSGKWKRASALVKKQAAEAVEQVLDRLEHREHPLTKEERNIRLQQAKEFFRQHAVDFGAIGKWSREDLYE